MPYDTEQLYKQALDIIEKRKCFFIEQLVCFLPCVKSTFYDHFPEGSNESNTIKEMLENNRINSKEKIYKKWEDSENPTLQISFMKLIGTEEERKKLSQSYTDITTKGDKINKTDLSLLTDDELRDYYELQRKCEGN